MTVVRARTLFRFRGRRPTKPRGRQQRDRDRDIRGEADPRTRPAQDTEHQRKAQDDVSRLIHHSTRRNVAAASTAKATAARSHPTPNYANATVPISTLPPKTVV